MEAKEKAQATTEVFKVLITGCYNGAWYSGKKGDIFNVVDLGYYESYTVIGEDLNIDKSDCHVIEPTWKVMKDAEETGRKVNQWDEDMKAWTGLQFWRPERIYRLAPETKQPKYEPYSYEDREKLRGLWVKHKGGKRKEVQIIGLSHDCVYAGADYAMGYRELFDNFLTALDGQPVGKLKTT